jgi:hypothetical protein
MSNAVLIYISGSGRSGSTLMERVFHSDPRVCSVGELHCLWRLNLHELNCACGRSFESDPFWTSVLEVAKFDTRTLEELRSLESRISRTGFLLRNFFSLRRIHSDTNVRRFLELQEVLVNAISEVSGKPIVVDSSKAGPRSWLLATLSRTLCLHLYRDPTDVLASWCSKKFDPGLGTHMKRMSVLDAASDWLKVEVLGRLLGMKRSVVRVNYLEMCKSPQQTFQYVALQSVRLKDLHVNWSSASTFVQGTEYHSLNGNPDRFSSGPVNISAKRASFDGIGAFEAWRIKLVGGVLRLLF